MADPAALPMSRLRASDLAHEALAALIARPARSVLTGLGTVLGVGTLVTILGLTTTAQAQVSARFDALAATTVTVEDHHTATPVLTPEAADRVSSLVNGVEAVGYHWPVSGVADVRVVASRPVSSRSTRGRSCTSAGDASVLTCLPTPSCGSGSRWSGSPCSSP